MGCEGVLGGHTGYARGFRGVMGCVRGFRGVIWGE